jgi:hypothetical protein
MPTVTTIIGKYTGRDITEETILGAARHGDPIRTAVAGALYQAAYAVIDAETDLRRITTSIADSLAKTTENVTATAGQQVRGLNPIGELQSNAPRFDALVAVRHERVSHLQALVRLWLALPPQAEK